MKKTEKPTKVIKITFTYKEYEKGSRSLHYDKDKAKEIVRWIAKDYLYELLYKDKNWP